MRRVGVPWGGFVGRVGRLKGLLFGLLIFSSCSVGGKNQHLLPEFETCGLLVMDSRVVTGILRYWSKSQVEAAYKECLAAIVEEALEVTITSATFAGGSQAGELRGDPQDLCDTFEECLRILEARESDDADEAGSPDPTYNFGSRRVRT